METIIQDFHILIGLFISAGGVTVAIFYNALKIKQNTKSQYYQILKDLHLRFNNIQSNTNDGQKYRMEMTNLALFIKELLDAKIINKKQVLQPYKFAFGEAIWNIQRMNKNMTKEIDTIEFLQFCKENNIKELIPPKWTFNDKDYKE